MRSAHFGRTIWVVTLLLAATLPIAAVPPAPARIQDAKDDGYGEWGWVGLISLLGLAGLMRRDRTYPANRAADRPTERVGRP